jgi:DNA-binding Lrp family transcriptional regulator
MISDNLIILNFAEAKQPEYREKRGHGYIEFGDKNDYPNYLLSLYNKSAKHNAIVRGKVNYIVGNGWELKDQDPRGEMFIKQPNQYESLNDLTRKVSIDIEIFGGAYLEVIWSVIGGQIAEMYHVDFTKIRSNKDNTQYWYKNDWSDRKEEADIIPAFNTQLRSGKQLLYIKEYRPGLDTYTLPGYMGALNYIESDVEVSRHVLGNAQTGFSASKLITLPNGEPTPDEKRNIERRFTDRFSGSDGKKFILSFVQDINKKPIVDDLGASDLSKEDFTTVDGMIQANIFAGHQITSPTLFGISTPGQLGTRTEIRDSYEVFVNTYVNDKQQFIESIFNQLARINGVSTELYIKPVEPINYEFSEATLVQVMTQDEIREKIGLPSLNKTDITTDQQVTTPEQNQAMINEHLKGLKGREWQNLQRVVREYNKGKITRDQATQMLKNGYGLSDDDVQTWLGEFSDHQDIDSIIQVFSEYGSPKSDFEILRSKTFFASDDIETQELQFRDEMVLDALDKNILTTISKNKNVPVDDIAKAVKSPVDEVLNRINTLVENEAIEYDVNSRVPRLLKPLSELLEKPVKRTYLVRYSYEWKTEVPKGQRDTPAHPSRPFCARLMEVNKLWSRADIQQMSARLGFSVFDRGGGWWGDSFSCRHRWVSHIVVKKS